MDSEKIKTGYLNAKHIFGRSFLTRNGNTNYSLQWQWTKKKTFINIIALDYKIYKDIKALLLPIKNYKEIELSNNYKAIIYYHSTSSKNYQRIKRYLIKHNLFKEE